MVAVTNDAAFNCSSESGSLFPVGNTTVTCQIAGGASATFIVAVAPPTPPVFSPATIPDIVVNSTSAQGAAVTFPAIDATDAMSGPPMLICNPPSGSFFSVGNTQVTCIATDRLGLSTMMMFSVRVVRDASFVDPSLTMPADIRLEGLAGATTMPVTFNVTASADVPFTCTPPSGGQFSIAKTTTVRCSIDSYPAVYEFLVTIAEPTPPVFDPAPTDMVVAANMPLGAVVSYSPTATDAESGPPVVECSPPSGSVPSPCGDVGAFTSCTNTADGFDFGCVCADGFAQDSTTAICIRSLSLQQAACANVAPQSFQFIATTSNTYSVCTATVDSLTCLTTAIDAGSAVFAERDPYGAPDQRFYIRPAPNNTGYTLSPVQQPTKCLAVEGASPLVGAALTLSDCPRLNAAVVDAQVFVLPTDPGIVTSGNLVLPYTVTMQTSNIWLNSNGDPNLASLLSFKTAFKDLVASVWSEGEGAPLLSADTISIVSSTVDSVPASFNDRSAYRRRSLMQQDSLLPLLPAAIGFVVTWPISKYPPDENALSAVCSATVRPKVDGTKPVVTASVDSVRLESLTAVAVTLPPVTATDDFYLTAPVTCTPPSGSVFPIGTTTAVCKALDGSGNFQIIRISVTIVGFVVTWPISKYPPDENALSAVCSATVRPKVDGTKPVVTASVDSVRLESLTAVAVTLPHVTATDDFYLTAPVTCTPPSGSVFPIGGTIAVCKALDGSGNFQIIRISVTIVGE
ncbi:hypothetical protein GPECTOR_650g767 [Gonium pectorale]|uniref:HYR domain-containing protein n=1 Tax=Gonium pectorale TaxID=33097 RepID=A0A150FUE2_GONPE|nr:hypothetical protein GPECTOR_650g767 [Gonium pectorale]|eukprot:KXZ41209.1 hypothetical protein GPECTOR_650g767 [Gonium pectorale]